MTSPTRYWRVPAALATAHTVLVLLIAVVAWTMLDGEAAGMIWIIPFALDLPASLVLFRVNDELGCAVGLLLFGGVWWAFVGAVFELFAGVYRSINRSPPDHG